MQSDIVPRVDEVRGKVMTDVQAVPEMTPMTDRAKPMALNDSTVHNLMDIVQRPVRIDTFEIAYNNGPIGASYGHSEFAQGVARELKSYSFPSDILKDAAPIVDKLSNFKYLRCNIEVEIKFNTNPFQQGLYMIAYTPLEGEVNRLRSTAPQGYAQLTSLPHAMVNLSVQNSAKLVLPYLNERDYIDLTKNPLEEMGAMRVYCVSPISGATSAETAVASVFASLVNVDVKVPCGVGSLAPFRQQSMEREIAYLKALKARQQLRETNAMVGQADTGDEPSATGPVAAIAGTVGHIAEAMSGVPLIGGIAKTVGWVARGVSKVATLFGWSKPTHAVIATDTVARPGYSMIHSEGKDHSIALAMIPDNQLLDHDVNPTKEDEMAIAYVVKQPNMINRTRVNVSDFTSGRRLMTIPVTPVQTNLKDTFQGKDTFYQGTLGYTSLMYQYWRGEVIFDFWLVKTAYHSGRFALVFQPEILNPADAPDQLGQQLSTNYNKVCDLNPADGIDAGGRWRLKVPYVSNEPWKETYPYDRDTAKEYTGSSTTGCVSVYALNELVCPETVDQGVVFVVMESGGEDFELAFPLQNFNVGYSHVDTTMTGESLDERSDPAVDPGVIIPSSHGEDVCPSTIGEYSKSLRALIKRSELWAVCDPDARLTFSPMQNGMDGEGRTAPPKDAPGYKKMYDTCFYQVSCMYRMYSGSSRVKVNYSAQGGGVRSKLTRVNARDPESKPITKVPVEGGHPTVFLDSKVNNLLELTIPFYSRLRARVCGPLHFQGIIPGVEVAAYGAPSMVWNSGTETESTLTDSKNDMELYTSAGDDLSFFFLVGPPPIHLR